MPVKTVIIDNSGDLEIDLYAESEEEATLWIRRNIHELDDYRLDRPALIQLKTEIDFVLKEMERLGDE